MDVKADECTLTKLRSNDPEHPVSWVSYVGLVKRGDPRSLKLIRMPLRSTKERAPGPGPITLALWRPIADQCLSDRPLMLHTDSARAYKERIPMVRHTSVIHQMKKVGKKWIQPTFVKTLLMRLPGGKKLKARSGTQTIDGFWTHLKRQVTRCRVCNPNTIDEFVRFAQSYWAQNHDPMDMLRESMPKYLPWLSGIQWRMRL